MLGLRQRLLTEGAAALELGRDQGRQLQRRAERETAAAELEFAFDQRRDHDDTADDDALIALQVARDLGGAEAAIAFAEDIFRRRAAAVLGDVKRDHFRHQLGVAMHAPEGAAAVGLCRPAPAGADRIDQHQIGEGEPGIGVVAEADIGAVMAVHAERGDARADQAEIEKSRGGARPAVEHEGQRSPRIVRFRHVGGIENRGRALARLVEQRECAGGRRIGELAGGRLDAVLGDGIARATAKGRRGRPVLADPGPDGRVRPGNGRHAPARERSRQRARSQGRDRKGNGGAAKIDHLCWSFSHNSRRPRPLMIAL